MDSIRWGVVGAGAVCEKSSGPPLYLTSRSSLELVHRRNREEGEEFVIRHGRGRYVESFDELINSTEIDAVYIATPVQFHEQQAIDALTAGKHVLVETPAALGPGGCERMSAAARDAGRMLGAAFYRRGFPSVQKAASILGSGLIGTPIAASLNNEFSLLHRLDLVHYFFDDISEVSRGSAEKADVDGERHTPVVSLLTQTGVNICTSDTLTVTGMPESMMIEGDEGIIYIQDLKGGEILVLARGGEERIQLSVPTLPFTHWGLIENFVEALTTGAPLLCPGEEAGKTARLFDLIGKTAPGSPAITVE